MLNDVKRFFRSKSVLLTTLLAPIVVMANNSVFASDVKIIEANGTEITYVEKGNGPLMILAHGSISDHRRWVKDHLPLLSEDYRVIAYTMRYHGDNTERMSPIEQH